MKRPTPDTDAVAAYEGNWDTKALRMTAHARKLERERDEAREAAAKWESSSDAMERAGAEQARRADENREWALRAERERDEARTVLERIVKLSINARRVEEDYAEWEKAVLAILDICEERKEK